MDEWKFTIIFCKLFPIEMVCWKTIHDILIIIDGEFHGNFEIARKHTGVLLHSDVLPDSQRPDDISPTTSDGHSPGSPPARGAGPSRPHGGVTENRRCRKDFSEHFTLNVRLAS